MSQNIRLSGFGRLGGSYVLIAKSRADMGVNEKIVIVGGGLAGLTLAIILQDSGFEVTVFEKKKYPFHRVCGEYVSNEVLPFLHTLGIRIADMHPSLISRLSVTTESGRQLTASLPLGGFGLSRYKLDEELFQHATRRGVSFIFEKVLGIKFQHNEFEIQAEGGNWYSNIAIAAYGKRSNLDQKLNRSFFYHRSPFLGVKYHIRTELPANLIRLDNFKHGYSGVCRIEDGKSNLCYLSKTSNLKKHQGIPEMEEQVLYRNPFLKYLFKNSEFIFDKPEVINEISFEAKKLIECHLLFCGDSAGMITPLCGNGMAMAFRSAKILSECIIAFAKKGSLNRIALEKEYRDRWMNEFNFRLQTGRTIQRLLGNRVATELAVSVLQKFPTLTQNIVKKTHGKAF